MSGSEMAHGALEFGLLGAFEVSRDGESLSVGGRRQRAILAMLVCAAGHAGSVERNCERTLSVGTESEKSLHPTSRMQRGPRRSAPSAR